MAKTDTFFDFDVTKYMTAMKVPGVDVDAVVAAQRKNVEALNAANRLAFEGFQAIAKRQAEIMRQAFEDAGSAASSLTSVTDPSQRMAKQTEVAKEAFEKSLSNMRELSEMVGKSNAEVMDLLNARFTASLDEMKTAIEKAPAAGFGVAEITSMMNDAVAQATKATAPRAAAASKTTKSSSTAA